MELENVFLFLLRKFGYCKVFDKQVTLCSFELKMDSKGDGRDGVLEEFELIEIQAF
jgi:hypothetical protein